MSEVRKLHLKKQNGQWWLFCKHGQRVGPFTSFWYARVSARELWVVHGGS